MPATIHRPAFPDRREPEASRHADSAMSPSLIETYARMFERGLNTNSWSATGSTSTMDVIVAEGDQE